MACLVRALVSGAPPPFDPRPFRASRFVEFDIETERWTDNLYDPPLEVNDGKVAVPADPGWGVTLGEAWLAKAKRRVSERR